MVNPSKIKEGNIIYSLGDFDGEVVTYDFPKMLSYLEVKGKLLFGNRFQIYEWDRDLLFLLCNYIIKDEANCRKLDVDPNKGLLISGPVGCGKTSFMKLLKHLVPHQKNYEVIPCRNVVFAFNHLGFKTVEDYGNSGYFCFDDLGVEPFGRYYGQDCNVIGEIFLSRYDLFQETGIKTHATTNLQASELEDRYGSRVRSRMRELFNLIDFDPFTNDKRQ